LGDNTVKDNNPGMARDRVPDILWMKGLHGNKVPEADKEAVGYLHSRKFHNLRSRKEFQEGFEPKPDLCWKQQPVEQNQQENKAS
jgi:hypothetical protein